MAPPPIAELHVRDLGHLAYAEAHAEQLATRDAVRGGDAPDTLLLVEHDPVVTLGRRGDRSGVLSAAALEAAGIPVVPTERGGHVTYHGPGQLVAYPILDLRRHGADLRRYVGALEAAAVDTLAAFGIAARADAERHGVYTAHGKIASVGVHVSRWVTMHGIALNIAPDMAHWALIAPCNLTDVEATSMAIELGGEAPARTDVAERFIAAFARRFGLRPVSATASATAAQASE